MDKLESTLAKIAKLLNDEKIMWNVGGSVLLSHFDLHESPHDIDIIVSKADSNKVEYILSGLGEMRDVEKSDVFQSDYYRKFIINGTEVDLIAGFKIKHAEGVYEYKPEFWGEKDNDGVIYAQLEDWYVIYQLMPNGAKKAKKIEEYLRKH